MIFLTLLQKVLLGMSIYNILNMIFFYAKVEFEALCKMSDNMKGCVQ